MLGCHVYLNTRRRGSHGACHPNIEYGGAGDGECCLIWSINRSLEFPPASKVMGLLQPSSCITRTSRLKRRPGRSARRSDSERTCSLTDKNEFYAHCPREYCNTILRRAPRAQQSDGQFSVYQKKHPLTTPTTTPRPPCDNSTCGAI